MAKQTDRMEVVYQDDNMQLEEEHQVVIRDQASLIKWMSIINENRYNKWAIPEVDFKNQSLILVSMGTKNTGGYTIQAPTSVPENSVYTFKYISPAAEDMVTMSLTSPGVMIRVPETSKAIQVVIER